MLAITAVELVGDRQPPHGGTAAVFFPRERTKIISSQIRVDRDLAAC